jgi:hypothetical protein
MLDLTNDRQPAKINSLKDPNHRLIMYLVITATATSLMVLNAARVYYTKDVYPYVKEKVDAYIVKSNLTVHELERKINAVVVGVIFFLGTIDNLSHARKFSQLSNTIDRFLVLFIVSAGIWVSADLAYKHLQGQQPNAQP